VLYEDFLGYLEKNNLNVKKVTSILGYGDKSIYNNWKKEKDVPEIALKSLNYYLELNKEKEENIKLNKQIAMLNTQIKVEHKLSNEALGIAKKKCIENNLRIEDYLSSLVLSNI